jgi:hypothetical protein
MKCSDCNQLITASSVIDNVEYFICESCGECAENNFNPNILSLDVLYRKGSGNTRESYSSNFSIDGVPLLKMLIRFEGDNIDFLGCFARGWDKLNEHSKKQLLLLELPEMDSGRCLIYLCPECADVGCGAYGCIVKKDEDFYVWESFAYENGRENPQIIEGVGSYKFKASEYEKIISRAYEL